MSNRLLSVPEKTFIIHGIQDNFRSDGRDCLQYRFIELETDVTSNCNGSAHVRLANTDILVGVKAELDAPNPFRPDEGRLEFFVDCSANADPEFEGRGGEEIADEITQILKRAYSSPDCLDLKSLCIIPKAQVWVIYVDVLILECGGSLADATSVAVKAALFNTKIPSIALSVDEEGQTEIEVSDDPFDFKKLDLSSVPCLVSLSRIGQKFVVDPSQSEETCSLGKLVLAVTEKGTITSVRKTGSGSLHAESVLGVLETGKDIGLALNLQLMKMLNLETSVKKKRTGFLI